MTWAAFRRLLSKGCALLMVLRRQVAKDVMLFAERRKRPFRMRVATAAYLLTYAGSVCQWPYEYQFYGQCGLERRDVYIILGMQQLAVLFGPYLAWLCFQRSTGPIMSPRITIIVCLLATAAACEAKKCCFYREAAVIVGLGPSMAAWLLDIREHVVFLRHLQVYVSISTLASTGVLVDVCGFGVKSVYSLASALYMTAAMVVFLCLNETTDVVHFRQQAIRAQDTRMRLHAALCRLAELLEDTRTLTTNIARFLMDVVAVLNRSVFELTGPQPCGRTVTSVAVVFLFRQTIEVIAMGFAVVLRTWTVTNLALKGIGAVACLTTFAISFRGVTPPRSEFCTAHVFLAFGTTVATAGDVTQPWHQSTLSRLLATAILLWSCVDSQQQFAVVMAWMSSFTVMAMSTVITGVLVCIWCHIFASRKRTVIETNY